MGGVVLVVVGFAVLAFLIVIGYEVSKKGCDE